MQFTSQYGQSVFYRSAALPGNDLPSSLKIAKTNITVQVPSQKKKNYNQHMADLFMKVVN